ncbi:tetraspanin [Histoplasma capsulatum G186AR]|uniref:Tetraspanin n=1 Tax=Ajellomyces capsulatus TaxID=5037 RepID=A0A8H7ZBF8_AJECA|nr:tetraspanin [Histoplasma capsulatum]QSS76193.1 tetraspanin [Histoplasma capsulatum G186AR]
MASISTAIVLILGCLAGLVAIILSAYSWFRTSKYYLPLPIALSGVTTFFPIAAVILIPLATNLAARIRSRRSDTTSLGSIEVGRFTIILEQLLTIIPTALAAFAISYFAPEDILGCRLENQWQSFYSHKNAIAIRSIQDRLQCCGFRSTRDRGWPFPSASDKRDCTSAFGYTQSCFAGWRSAQRQAATMVFTAAILSLVMKFILSSRQYGLSTRYPHLSYYMANGDTENTHGTHANGFQRRLITDVSYHDEPGEDERHRVSLPPASPSLNGNPFGDTNGHGDAENNLSDNYHTEASGALYISNLRP